MNSGVPSFVGASGNLKPKERGYLFLRTRKEAWDSTVISLATRDNSDSGRTWWAAAELFWWRWRLDLSEGTRGKAWPSLWVTCHSRVREGTASERVRILQGVTAGQTPETKNHAHRQEQKWTAGRREGPARDPCQVSWEQGREGNWSGEKQVPEYGDLSLWGGLPWWLRRWSVCLQCRRPGFNPWLRKIPWRRKWQPTPVLLPGKFHGWRSLVAYSPRHESDTTEQLHWSIWGAKTATLGKSD